MIDQVRDLDIDQGTLRKVTVGHNRTARWVIGAEVRPSTMLCAEYARGVSVSKIYLGQEGARLLNSVKFGEAPKPLRVRDIPGKVHQLL